MSFIYTCVTSDTLLMRILTYHIIYNAFITQLNGSLSNVCNWHILCSLCKRLLCGVFTSVCQG